MNTPTETMEERFKKKFTNIGTLVVPSDVPVRFVEKEKEVLEFIHSELSLSQNRILEEVIEQVIDEIMKLPRVLVDVRMSPEDSHQYEPAVEIRDISLLRSRFKLITKKDNQSTLTKGN